VDGEVDQLVEHRGAKPAGQRSNEHAPANPAERRTIARKAAWRLERFFQATRKKI
jgi:hypothetical protein